MCTTYAYLLKHNPVRQMPMTRQQAGTHNTYLTAPAMRPTKREPDPDSKGRAHNSAANGTKGPLGLVACPLTAAQDPAKQQWTIVTGCAEGRSRPRPNTQRATHPWVHAPPAPNQYTNEEAICVLEKCTLRPLPRQYTNVKAICVLEPCTLRPLPRQYTNVKAICVID